MVRASLSSPDELWGFLQLFLCGGCSAPASFSRCSCLSNLNRSKDSRHSQLVFCSSSLWSEVYRSAPASWAESSCPPPTAGRQGKAVKHRTGRTSIRRSGGVTSAHLVCQLSASPLVATDAFLILLALLLLHHQLGLQLPHLCGQTHSGSQLRLLPLLQLVCRSALTLASSLCSCFFPPLSAICSASSSLTCSSVRNTHS